jgi:hypothetical protein
MPNTTITAKRQRSGSGSPDPDPAPKKRHRPNRATPILRLSDELFLRIAAHLPTRDLAALQLVSHRCSRIAVDGQIWKALYYRRYVRPRASRIPGLLRTQLGDYSSRRSVWLEEEGIAREAGTNWKALYRLKHNWVKGACGVREIDVAGGVADGAQEQASGSGLLVRMFEVRWPRVFCWAYHHRRRRCIQGRPTSCAHTCACAAVCIRVHRRVCGWELTGIRW